MEPIILPWGVGGRGCNRTCLSTLPWGEGVTEHGAHHFILGERGGGGLTEHAPFTLPWGVGGGATEHATFHFTLGVGGCEAEHGAHHLTSEHLIPLLLTVTTLSYNFIYFFIFKSKNRFPTTGLQRRTSRPFKPALHSVRTEEP